MTRSPFAWPFSLLIMLTSACDRHQPEAKDSTPAPAPAADPSEPPAASREAPAAAQGVDHGGFTVVDVADSGELSALLTKHAAKAKAAGLTPHVEFWASWCGPCKALEASMSDERMKTAFAGSYIIRMNFDHWSPALAGTGLESASIPVFFELDPAGKPTGRKIDGGAWGDNIPENMAPPLHAYFHGERS